MLTKLLEHKWTIITVVVAIAVIYYFYQKNQTTNPSRAPLLG